GGARAGLEPAALRPLLRSPRAAPRIAVTAAALPSVAFVADRLSPAAQAYVAAHRALADRPTLAARDRWWALPAAPARLFLTKAYHGRFVQPLADEPVVPDQRFYAVEPRRGARRALPRGRARPRRSPRAPRGGAERHPVGARHRGARSGIAR